MTLDLSRLENVRSKGGAIVARCPACALEGRDQSGEHLWIRDEGAGPYVCIVNRGLQGAAHRKMIKALAGPSAGVVQFPVNRRRTEPKSCIQTAKAGKAVRIPSLEALSDELMMAIAELRGWHSHKGLELLSARGLLWYADVWDSGAEWPAWLITDSARKNAQARTFDGSLWPKYQCKAKSMPGTDPSWPIGAADIGDRPFVIFCEGQPDFCASLLVAWYECPELAESIAPVCMVGAGNNIHPDALRHFRDKRVRIPFHNDEDGQGLQAARKWKKQMEIAGAKKVDGVDFGKMSLTAIDGRPLKDLADYATRLDGEIIPSETVFAGFE